MVLVSSSWASGGAVKTLQNLPREGEIKPSKDEPVPSPERPQEPLRSKSRLSKLKEEVFNVLLEIINMGKGAASRISGVSCDVSYPGLFEDILVDEEALHPNG